MGKKGIILGVGVGICLSCLIFFITYSVKSAHWSEQLAMLQGSAPTPSSLLKAPDENEPDSYYYSTPDKSESAAPSVTEQASSAVSPPPSAMPAQAPVDTFSPTPAMTPIPTALTEPVATQTPSLTPAADTPQPGQQPEAVKSEPPQQPGDVPDGYVSVVIHQGMSSKDICGVLYENGIIDDAAAFNDYLITTGYTKKISYGNYILNSELSFSEILQILKTD